MKKFSLKYKSICSIFFLTSGLIFSIPSIFFTDLIKPNPEVMFNQKPKKGFAHIEHEPNSELDSVASYSEKINDLSKAEFNSNLSTSDNYVKTLREIIKKNYIHGVLKYKCSNHWMACILSKTNIARFSDVLNVLDVNHISQAKHSFCSQQALLVQAILKKDGHNYISVKFTTDDGGHFATATFIGGKTYFIDTDLDPIYESDGNQIARLLSNNSNEFFKLYREWFPNAKTISTRIEDFSQFPASRGILVQKIIFFTEKYLWLFFLGAFLLIRGKDFIPPRKC